MVESTNLPETSYNLVINDADAAAADYGAAQLIFFGPQASASALVVTAQILLNNNDDQPFHHHDLVSVCRF